MSTTLASRYDPKEAQDRWYEFWEKNGYFNADPDDRPPQRRYTIVIPPPNVTGALHMGHALNNTLQDILIRWRRMQGYNTLWMPGTDHAGIATQAVVERRIKEQEGKTRHDLGREELVRRIWEWKDEYERRILNQLRKLGCSCDWRRTRFTFDEGCSRAVRETFFKMFRDGLIYRGKRLVNWDTQLQTSVADDETYTEEVKGGFWTFKYPVKSSPHAPREESGAAVDVGGQTRSPHAEREGYTEFLRFSTTRPETMLGDTAVAVHPNDPRYKHLIGRTVVIPIAGNREIPIIADGLLVDPELGTGCVKVTPAHDPNDYACGLRHKLPMINILNPDGTINENGGPDYKGLDRYITRERVTADMERLGLFEGREDRLIPLKFSDRSKTPIEPLLSDQWFVRMADAVGRSASQIEPARNAIDPATMAAECGPDAIEHSKRSIESLSSPVERRTSHVERSDIGISSSLDQPSSSLDKPSTPFDHISPSLDQPSTPIDQPSTQLDQPSASLDLTGSTPDSQVTAINAACSGTDRLSSNSVSAGSGLAELAMQAVRDGRVKIHPERYAKTYLDWLGEKRDWCISRQLWWGHRIPVWRLTLRGDELINAEPEWTMKLLGGSASTNVAARVVDSKGTPINIGDKSRLNESETYDVLACVRDDRGESEADHVSLTVVGFEQDPDVLDTWFSSQLWPHSTLGWPERTRELEYYYPTSVLVTSRDIITLWVARMVIAGLYNCGEVPFRDVYITPKILDGFGQTMSKSKGNGVDPLDIIDKYGADALRFAIAQMTTESQDARLPVGYECPFCQTYIAQKLEHQQMKPKVQKPDAPARDARESSAAGAEAEDPSLARRATVVKPRIKCPSCKNDFQFSSPNFDPDPGEPVARVVSERFEQGRNFANKLWNAARFALMNLEDFHVGWLLATTAPHNDESRVVASNHPTAITTHHFPLTLADEERWILSRLAATVADVTDHLENFRFSEVAKSLYEFSWSEFCDWYVEMAKLRLKNPATRATAQRVLATVLDYLLRLLHPVMPFVTEQIWQALGELAPERGLGTQYSVLDSSASESTVTDGKAAESVMIAPWPVAPSDWRNPEIEKRMARLQELIKAIRNIRSNFNVDPRTPVAAHVRCSAAVAEEVQAATPFIEQLATVRTFVAGPEVTKPADSVSAVSTDWELYVPLTGLIDRPAEIERQGKLRDSIAAQLKSFQSKLANADFVSKAPPDVVELHRQRVAELIAQAAAVEAILRELGGAK